MKKLTAVLLAGLIAGAPLFLLTATKAHAFGKSRYYPEAAIVEWSGQRFNITRIDFLESMSDERLRLESWVDANPDKVAALQNSIRNNRKFAAALRARRVQLNNVVAVQRALNGNLIVFLR